MLSNKLLSIVVAAVLFAVPALAQAAGHFPSVRGQRIGATKAGVASFVDAKTKARYDQKSVSIRTKFLTKTDGGTEIRSGTFKTPYNLGKKQYGHYGTFKTRTDITMGGSRTVVFGVQIKGLLR